MRHNVYGKHLGRNKNQRTALFRGLIRALVLEGSIVTTEAKTKAIKGLVDKLFAKAKKGDTASQNVIVRTVPQKEVVKRMLELSKLMKNRNSGFTQTVRLGTRAGDGAMMMKMSIISDKSEDKQSLRSDDLQKISGSEKEELESKEEKKVEKLEKKEKEAKTKITKKVSKK
ncbi:MAG: bL17 family ribosomal protein [Microgenomates group bacterium]